VGRQGPFADEDFLNLRIPAGRCGWRMPRSTPGFGGAAGAVPFHPRLADRRLTIRYATPPGTVEPRVNDDDVFLLQGQGRQYWQIAAGTAAPDADQPDAGFVPEQEWALNRAICCTCRRALSIAVQR